MVGLRHLIIGAIVLAVGIGLAPRAAHNISSVRLLGFALQVSPYSQHPATREAPEETLTASVPKTPWTLDSGGSQSIVLSPRAFSGTAASVVQIGELADGMGADEDVLVLWTYTEAVAHASATPGLYLVRVVGRAGPLPPVQVLLRANGRSLAVLTFAASHVGWEPRYVPLYLGLQESGEGEEMCGADIGLVFLNDYVGDLGDRNAEIAQVELMPIAPGWRP